MTNLTDKWKKGELNRNKVYYYETPFNTKDTASGYWLCNHLDTEKDKVEILGEVPSYEQWQQLKELLKECRSPINYALCLNLSEEEKIEFKNLLAKINQVLGEE